MNRIISRLTCLAGLVLLLAATPATARNCTRAEKRAADRQLWLNARDQQLSIDTNLPWGAPGLAPDSSHEHMLAQRDYVIRYDGDLRTPLFTAERVDSARLGKVSRTDCFRKDVRIDAAEASGPPDYNEPIFDQGHLAAFADQATSIVAGDNSFIMSNMAPQTCQFNRGIWQILEGIVRLWALDHRTVYVISGSIFDRDGDGLRDPDEVAARMHARNGTSRVAIPTGFYKIVAFVGVDGTIHTLSIVLPHSQENPKGDAAVAYLSGHLTTVADIKRQTGLDFFPRASALAEDSVLWPFNAHKMPRSLCRQPARVDFDAIWRAAP